AQGRAGVGVARRAGLRHSRRRETDGAGGAAPSRDARSRAGAGRGHVRRRPEGDSRQDRSPDGVNLPAFLLASAASAAFFGLWYVVGVWAGILWTSRAVAIAAAVASLGLAGLWVPWALDALLVADGALVLAVWLDARLAPVPGVALRVEREVPPAYSVGHAGWVRYRWLNATRRGARLRVREVRPDVIAGLQPPRFLDVPAGGAADERLDVLPVRRGKETEGA